MAQDVINMPQVKQYMFSVKHIQHFMSQMTLESGTIFTVYSVMMLPCVTCFATEPSK
jgi:hypothetical protein